MGTVEFIRQIGLETNREMRFGVNARFFPGGTAAPPEYKTANGKLICYFGFTLYSTLSRNILKDWITSVGANAAKPMARSW